VTQGTDLQRDGNGSRAKPLHLCQLLGRILERGTLIQEGTALVLVMKPLTGALTN